MASWDHEDLKSSSAKKSDEYDDDWFRRESERQKLARDLQTEGRTLSLDAVRLSHEILSFCQRVEAFAITTEGVGVDGASSPRLERMHKIANEDLVAMARGILWVADEQYP